ncbi:hypothetical protein KC19_2G107900 [Ceratodon purpureus]|uniref:Uncharacterized protein n=1 Tax=Ceratodon purpureus TaxID=3225 RepID=A0A8T0IV28_CERPU|nr:hypothetical protein KC19_2G107900 [Ceratodon purpureus]
MSSAISDFFTISVAALTSLFSMLRCEQNLLCKSPAWIVPISMEMPISSFNIFTINVDALPISVFDVPFATEDISLNVRGLSSCRQAMYKQAASTASWLRPRIDFRSSTFLYISLARSLIVDTSPSLSAMVPIDFNAMISDRSGFEPLFCHRTREDMKSSCALDMIVDSLPSRSVRSGFEGPPTRSAGSLDVESENVRHSELSSTECCSSTSPHSSHTISPAAWSTSTSFAFRHSGHIILFIFTSHFQFPKTPQNKSAALNLII